jgi:hypothetical protein
MDNRKLTQLSNAFSVQDVMTEVIQLERADTLGDAKNLFHEYDIIPYPKRGLITGFFRKDSAELHNIDLCYIVSEGTSLFDLPQLFCEKPFYFVISSNRIAGYIHYSDLNKPIVKVPFFAISQAVERKLWEQIEDRISEDDLRQVFYPQEVGSFLKKKSKAEKHNIDLGWIDIFSFQYILKLARFYSLIGLSDEQIKLLTEVRNKTAHSDKYLVRDKKEVLALADAHRMFQSLID